MSVVCRSLSVVVHFSCVRIQLVLSQKEVHWFKEIENFVQTLVGSKATLTVDFCGSTYTYRNYQTLKKPKREK